MDFLAVWAEVVALSVDERLVLVEAIWEMIEADRGRLSERQELDRRMAAHEADPRGVVAWEEVQGYHRKAGRNEVSSGVATST